MYKAAGAAPSRYVHAALTAVHHLPLGFADPLRGFLLAPYPIL